MAIPHCGWLTTDRELNCAAKAAASVNFFVTHDAPPWWLALILTYLGMRSLLFKAEHRELLVRAGHNRVRVMKVGLIFFREIGIGPFEPIETQWIFPIHEPDGEHQRFWSAP